MTVTGSDVSAGTVDLTFTDVDSFTFDLAAAFDTLEDDGENFQITLSGITADDGVALTATATSVQTNIVDDTETVTLSISQSTTEITEGSASADTYTVDMVCLCCPGLRKVLRFCWFYRR